MTGIYWAVSSRGAQYRPPTFRVQVSRVVAAPATNDPGPGQWREEAEAAYLTPVKLNWGVNGRPTTVTVRRVLGQGGVKASVDRAEDPYLTAGDRIRLVEVQRGGERGTNGWEWFRGYVAQERMLIQAGPDVEVCDYVAYGPEILLRSKVVSGQWHPTPDVDEAVTSGADTDGLLVRANTFCSYLPVVFNEGGRPNASPSTSFSVSAAWRLDGRSEAETPEGRTFDGPDRKIVVDGVTYQAAFWRAKPAIQSLVEMVDDYSVISPESMAMLPSALSETEIGEVDVEGMDLLEALRAILLPIGYGFTIEPWADSSGRHNLRVFGLQGKTDDSRIRRPFMVPIHGTPARLTDPEAQRAEVQRIEFIRDNHNVVNDVVVIGAQKRIHVALAFSATDSQLKPAWDTDAHDLADWTTDGIVAPMHWPISGQGARTIEYFDQHYSYGGKGTADSRHVFRSFVWNEDGAFNGFADGMADLKDYGVGEEGHFIRRPRPVGPTLLRDEPDAKVRNLPSLVQLGIEGDEESWVQIPAVIWADRAGFTIPINPLWDWHPYATEYGRHAVSGEDALCGKYGKYSYLTLLQNALQDTGVKLRLRLVGSVESDEAVVGHAARRARSSWPFVAAKVVRADSRFRCHEVPDASDPFTLPSNRHDVRDDRGAAKACAERIRDVLEDEVGHGSVVLRRLTRSYSPGDVIPGTQGRVIDLTVRSGEGKAAPLVVEVVWNFEEGTNKTELVLDTPLLKVMQ